MTTMTTMTTMNNHLKEGELFLKYKSSYKSSLIDLSIHLSLLFFTFYFLRIFFSSQHSLLSSQICLHKCKVCNIKSF